MPALPTREAFDKSKPESIDSRSIQKIKMAERFINGGMQEISQQKYYQDSYWFTAWHVYLSNEQGHANTTLPFVTLPSSSASRGINF